MFCIYNRFLFLKKVVVKDRFRSHCKLRGVEREREKRKSKSKSDAVFFGCTKLNPILFFLFFSIRHVAESYPRIDGSRLRPHRWVRSNWKSSFRIQPQKVGKEALGGNGRKSEETSHPLARFAGKIGQKCCKNVSLQYYQL